MVNYYLVSPRHFTAEALRDGRMRKKKAQEELHDKDSLPCLYQPFVSPPENGNNNISLSSHSTS